MEEKKIYRTAVYLRLSKGDGDVDGIEKSESNSISNQRLITNQFLKQHPELEVVDTYIDDGYTGTNFKRPELKRMMYDVDDGRIDCIVVKDLSRFGRERIDTGKYIQMFRGKGIRFIAINDHYDSLTSNGSDDHLIMPIKALTNDNFSRDISLKVRSSLSVKRQKGEWVASLPPYGYKKDPKNVNHLLIDEPAAEVVRRIFAMKIEGYSANHIAEELNRMGVMTPGDYKRSCGLSARKGKTLGRCKWSAVQVIRILHDQSLLGKIVQGKKTTVSYKVNKVISKPVEEWDIVDDMHDPIISEADFQIVQSLLERDVIKIADDESPNIFAGLLFCGDCGRAMHRRKRPLKNGSVYHYCCGGYSKHTGCSSHDIREEELVEIVRGSLNGMIRKLCRYDELAHNLENLHISREDAVSNDLEIRALKEELAKYRRLKSALYQDLKEGLISEAQCERYREQYTEREIELQGAIQAQKELINRIYQNGIAADELLQRFRENTEVDELNHRLLVSMIDRIMIYEDNTIEIIYRYSDEMKKCEQILQSAS